jgi:hypothetical protein
MTDYRLFGLRKNPFEHHLLDAHIERSVDVKLAAIFDEISQGEREKAGLSLGGSEGYGKTETLRMLEAKANKEGIFSIFSDARNISTIRDKIVKRPKILRPKRKKDANIERDIVSAMNRHKPSLLLLDNLQMPEQNIVSFVFDGLEWGMVVFSCSECEAHDFSLLELPPLTDEEAVLIVGKRLALYRYSQNMDPLYPFSHSFLCELNRDAGGNPGTLIERLDSILKDAAEKKIFPIVES